jgi:hypothetical protein
MAVVVRPGDSNDLVRLLQARLNRDYPLYSNLVVDGIYGPRTTDPDRASGASTRRTSSARAHTISS